MNDDKKHQDVLSATAKFRRQFCVEVLSLLRPEHQNANPLHFLAKLGTSKTILCWEKKPSIMTFDIFVLPLLLHFLHRSGVTYLLVASGSKIAAPPRRNEYMWWLRTHGVHLKLRYVRKNEVVHFFFSAGEHQMNKTGSSPLRFSKCKSENEKATEKRRSKVKRAVCSNLCFRSKHFPNSCISRASQRNFAWWQCEHQRLGLLHGGKVTEVNTRVFVFMGKTHATPDRLVRLEIEFDVPLFVRASHFDWKVLFSLHPPVISKKVPE